MADVNFAELLSQQVDSVERPKLFPKGSYNAIVLKHTLGTSTQKATPYVEFDVKLLSPQSDVDEELFEAAGGQEALDKRAPLRLTFYITQQATYRLREFLETTLELNCNGRNFDAVIPEATNAAFTAEIDNKPGKKEGEYYMNVVDHAKAV